MDAELTQLEAQIERLVSLCEVLRIENRSLRAHAAKLEADNHALSDKVLTASNAFQNMLENLPQD